MSASDSQDTKSKDIAIGLHHPARKFPLTVMMTALNDAPDHLISTVPKGSVALYISDSEASFNAPFDSLRSLYSMTVAEAKVAIAIANGLSIQDIAEQSQVSVSTVRTHLKSIFSKMGVNKQQDIVRTLLGGALNIR